MLVVPCTRYTSYAVTAVSSVDAAQVRVAPVEVIDEATGVPGTVGAVVSPGWVPVGSLPYRSVLPSYRVMAGALARPVEVRPMNDGSLVASQPDGPVSRNCSSRRCCDWPPG